MPGALHIYDILLNFDDACLAARILVFSQLGLLSLLLINSKPAINKTGPTFDESFYSTEGGKEKGKENGMISSETCRHQSSFQMSSESRPKVRLNLGHSLK